MSKREIEKRKKRMRDIVGRFQEYVRTYTEQRFYDEYSDDCFISDMVYGVGIAIEPEKWSTGEGFDLFRERLRQMMAPTRRAP